MAKLSESLIREFAKMTKDTAVKKPESFLYGTVDHIEGTSDDTTVFVLFDGGNDLTPCRASVNVAVGDRILAMFKNRQAIITANISNPTINASYLEAGEGVFTGSVKVLGSNEGITQTVEISPGEGPAIEIIGGETGLGTSSRMEINSNQTTIIEIDTALESIREATYHSSNMISFQDRINDLSSVLQADKLAMYGSGTAAQFDRYGAHTSSDVRLKKDIEPISSDLALKLRPVKFRFKEDDSIHYGFIAQDVQTVLPDAVHTGENGYLSLTYSELIAPILSLVQDLERRVKELESKCNKELSD